MKPTKPKEVLKLSVRGLEPRALDCLLGREELVIRPSKELVISPCRMRGLEKALLEAEAGNALFSEKEKTNKKNKKIS